MGAATFHETLGRSGVGASSELILFMFLMSMVGGIGLIEARRPGVIRWDPPVDIDPGPLDPPRAGHQPARNLLGSGLVMILGSALLFGVRWGDPVAAALLLVAFALVGTGAAMLLGATCGPSSRPW